MTFHFNIWNNNKYEHILKMKLLKSGLNLIFKNNAMIRILAIKILNTT
jgi:hypothetical protein